MNEKGFADFKAIQDSFSDTVRRVGEIPYSAQMDRGDYVLQTIHFTTEIYGQVPSADLIDEVIRQVVKYRLWDADNLNGNPPVFASEDTVTFEREFSEVDLSQRRLIKNRVLTEKGHRRIQMLSQMAIKG